MCAGPSCTGDCLVHDYNIYRNEDIKELRVWTEVVGGMTRVKYVEWEDFSGYVHAYGGSTTGATLQTISLKMRVYGIWGCWTGSDWLEGFAPAIFDVSSTGRTPCQYQEYDSIIMNQLPPDLLTYAAAGVTY